MNKFYLLTLLSFHKLLLIAQGQLLSYTHIATWTAPNSKDSMNAWIDNSIELHKAQKNALQIMLIHNYKAKTSIALYKVLYTTTNFDGKIVKASGLMAVPQSQDTLPFLIFEHATAYDKKDVPSHLRSTGERIECIFEIQLAQLGFILLAPDYIGWGDSDGLFSYMHSQSEANATWDMMRASQQLLVNLHQTYKKEVYLYGYSQGGHAAMASAKYMYESYTNEFPIKGIIAGNAPYLSFHTIYFGLFDEKKLHNTEDGNNRLIGLAAAQNMRNVPFRSISEIMYSPYDSLYKVYIQGLGGEVKKHLPTNWISIFRPEFIQQIKQDSSLAFWQYLKQQDVHDWANPYPTYFLYTKYDEHVPYIVTKKTYQRQMYILRKKGFWEAKWLKTHNLSYGNLLFFPDKMNHRTFSVFSFLFAKKQLQKWKNKYK